MLIDFAYFAEIIAAIGVILSLIYVGKQLKQTNTIARSAFRQTLGVAKNDFAMSVATSSSLAEVVSKVHEGLALNDAAPRDTIQVGYAYWALIGHVHLAFEHWKDGILTEDDVLQMFGKRTGMLTAPFFVSVWNDILHETYPPEFSNWFTKHFVSTLAHTADSA